MRLFISLVLLVSLASSPAWAESCRTAVLLGYWPPTNEMLRPFSTSPRQNPEGWRGRNWRNLGYNVHAYFPEFPPDGDPTNDQIGEPGSVGAKGSDFQVDYQDTSRDFWRIMAVHKPAILITNSRGGEIGWELEAVEGGHGTGDQSAELDWIADRYGQVHLPEQSSVDRRSWAAITTYRAGERLASSLPLAEILRRVQRLDLVSSAIDENTSGNYLSGFMGLHGLAYAKDNTHVQAAGHIHVGRSVSVEDAQLLLEVSLQTTLERHPPNCEAQD